MKKSTLVALVLGIISGLLFSLGMCMVLLPEWNVFVEGIGVGAAGMVLGLVTVFVWQMMEHDGRIRWGVKSVLLLVLIVAGALGVGIGCVLLSRGVEVWWELVSFFRSFWDRFL